MPKPKIHSKTGKPSKVVHNDRPDEDTRPRLTAAHIFTGGFDAGRNNGRQLLAIEVLEMIEDSKCGRQECVLQIIQLLEKELYNAQSYSCGKTQEI